jgi:5-methylcytosine-specific restriction protein B
MQMINLTSTEIEKFFTKIYKNNEKNKYALFPALYIIWKYGQDKYISYDFIQKELEKEFGYNIESSYHFSQVITQTRGKNSNEYFVTDNARFLQNLIQFKTENDESLKQDPDGYNYSSGLKKTYFKIRTENLEALNSVMEKFKNEHIDEIKMLMKEKRDNGYRNDKNLYGGSETQQGEHVMKQSLNQILYGPPGTGKTYNTINKALEIIFSSKDMDATRKYTYMDGDVEKTITYREAFQNDDRKGLQAIFDYFRKEKQIEFVTFHQSYGYEDFIEGIRASTSEDDEITYRIERGIFKRISKKAEENYKKVQSKKFDKRSEDIEYDFPQIIDDYFSYVSTVIKDGDPVVLRKDVLIEEVNKLKNGEFKSFTLGGTVKSGQRLSKDIILRDIKKFFDNEITSYKDIRPSRDSESQWHGNALYYYALYKRIKEFVKKDEKKYIIKKDSIVLKNFILIIDEINRGNISKVFGELITLIEPTKRIGGEDELRVVLPYSGDTEEAFGVPQNLYIIGTMNTADRSIALLDTALRRRFEFVEMMPDLSILSSGNERIEKFNEPKEQENDLIVEEDNEKKINIRLLLRSINQRIEYLYDRDHTIGHSYFLSLKKNNSLSELSNIFKNKILPLLQEYFYDDWEKIRLVLADNQVKEEKYQFIVKRNFSEKSLFGKEQGDYREEKTLYEINKNAFLESKSYIKIYDNSNFMG